MALTDIDAFLAGLRRSNACLLYGVRYSDLQPLPFALGLRIDNLAGEQDVDALARAVFDHAFGPGLYDLWTDGRAALAAADEAAQRKYAQARGIALADDCPITDDDLTRIDAAGMSNSTVFTLLAWAAQRYDPLVLQTASLGNVEAPAAPDSTTAGTGAPSSPTSGANTRSTSRTPRG